MPGRNPDPRGYYALLHVSPEASRQEIGRAFRALMRRRHPDVGRADDAAGTDSADVRAILDAFTVLRNPRTRADYDAGAGRTGGQPGTIQPGTVQPGTDQASAGGRDIPVRIVRRRDPLLRVLPVRWEPGPGPGKHPRGGP